MSNYVFNNAPVLRRRRSKFDLSHSCVTSTTLGRLIPFDVQEVYPGDTFKVDTNIVLRTTSAFIKPMFGNMMLDLYYFFVPNRLTFDNWEDVLSVADPDEWDDDSETFVPKVIAPSGITADSVASYMGLPQGVDLASGFSALPFRAFALIYNEWFRDQNVIDPMLVQKGVAGSNEVVNTSAWGPSNYTGKCPSIAKFHDYFTSALPDVQKGEAVNIIPDGFVSLSAKANILEPLGTTVKFGSNGNANLSGGLGLNNGALGIDTGSPAGANPVNATNLGIESPFNVNDLRYAFAIQRILEREARSGSRYTEYLHSAFGVSAPDQRLQRPEYLGGKRIPLNIQQVVSTNGSEDGSLANIAAYSLSNGRAGYSKSFVEHGYVIGVAAIRSVHHYTQGVEKMWLRENRFEFYDPALMNIGEQPVYQCELYADGTTMPVSGDKPVFGYQEAWADLRYRKNLITGQVTAQSGLLSAYALQDDYGNAPVIGKQFVEENDTILDPVLEVAPSTQDPFILDMYHKVEAVRILDTYSVPSLIDHN